MKCIIKYISVYVILECFIIPLTYAGTSSDDFIHLQYGREWQYEVSYDIFNKYERIKHIDLKTNSISVDKRMARYLTLRVSSVHFSDQFKLNYGLGFTFRNNDHDTTILVDQEDKEYSDLSQEFDGAFHGFITFGYRIHGNIIELLPNIRSGVSCYLSHLSIPSVKTTYDLSSISTPLFLGIDFILTKLKEIEKFERISLYVGFDVGYVFALVSTVYNFDNEANDYYDNLIKLLENKGSPTASILGSLKFGLNYEL